MTIKLICSKINPPIGGLAVAELIKTISPVTVEWGSETSITLHNNTVMTTSSDNDILRTLSRDAPKLELYGVSPIERTQVDHWLTLAITFSWDLDANIEYLQKCLSSITYLVANRLTLADFAIFNEIYKITVNNKQRILPNHIKRWYDLINAQECIVNALNLLPNDVKESLGNAPPTVKSVEKSGQRKQEGKFVDLPGAEMGKVVVRFPPEASGYLHIGHAKAALLNQYYQQAFQGKLIMRFDDTNPAKETVEFENVILGDLEMLQIKPDLFTHTSQYFDLMLQYCETLLKEGKAYVDDTEPEQMKKEREQRMESLNRSNSVEKNFELWKEMCNGTVKGQKCCVRAKIDMSSPNGCLRDPTIYRCKNEPHPRTGTKYKVYPTYDFACPIVDAIENVTHTLRTMEYHDRDDQFYWFIDALKLRKPYIWEYSRLNMTNTVLSKRKLTWFVEQGLVDGWDDPRFPTVRGILRRGMTVEGLKEFIIAQGSSKSVVFMEWDKIWAFNKKVIDPIAPRYTALDKKTILVNVAGAKKESIQVPVHPKNTEIGMKTVWLGPEILIDYIDAESLKVGENATFINWGNLKINKINKTNGQITSVDASLNLDDKDFKKTVKLTWLCKMDDDQFPPTYCVYFNHIISKPILAKDEDFKQYIGHETRTEVEMIGDPELKKCKKGDIIQLQRRGFFKVDSAYAPPSVYTGVTSPVILFEIPDGHSKEKSTTIVTKSNQATTSSAPSKSNTSAINDQITQQGNIVRDLKTKKANKSDIDLAVKKLLELKAEYKKSTGADWKPSPIVDNNQSKAIDSDVICKLIAKQGDLVRNLKTQKASKGDIDAAVKLLLQHKTDYKAATGKDWTPNQVTTTAATSQPSSQTNSNADAICQLIAKQGDLVRNLKSQKASKADIDSAVKLLLQHKVDYKAATGKDWTPNQVTTTATASQPSSQTNSNADAISQLIAKQGDLVRNLKSQKASKADIDSAVKLLLQHKVDYKAATGKDWTPSTQSAAAPPSTQPNLSDQHDVKDLNNKIVKQGDLVRTLKSNKAAKSEIDEAVKLLLKLKSDYKQASGKDWKPDQITSTELKSASLSSEQKAQVMHTEEINNKIIEQGNLVRNLKTAKASKSEIDDAVKQLLTLKGDYKTATGIDWKPGCLPPPSSSSTSNEKVDTPKNVAINDDVKAKLTAIINDLGQSVRNLKSTGGSKDAIDTAVKELLEAKATYKKEIGEDFPVTGGRTQSSGKKTNDQQQSKPKKESTKPVKNIPAVNDTAPQTKDDGTTGPKKQTRLGLEAKKEENLPEWYSQVITKGELIEYYDVSGCYILRPWSFAIWRTIQTWFANEIAELGVKEVYFPMFVSKSALEKEKTHIADFSPEVAWVTKSGESDLAEPIAIRPTSETIMYPAFAKWIQSHRDLPLRFNQWSNVVRWEFKHPQPFLRTREFLWQEGHTAYSSKADAEKEVLQILDLYAKIYTDLLAIPVTKGRKTEKEKFAGGDFTTTVEAFVSASGRSIQGGTSHHLGQNFSKMFEIVYEDPTTKEKQYVYQNSWGLTTRTIGVMIMVHGDNKGLVLPPHVACTQVVIVPCGITASATDDDRKDLQTNCVDLEKSLKAASVRVEGDYRDNYSPGWKFNHWELKGVPIRIELGPKDIKANQIVVVRRDTGEKITISRQDATKRIPELLEDIHKSMYDKAAKDFKEHLKVTKEWTEFCQQLDKKNVLLSPFCGDIDCEGKIKDDSATNEADAEPGALTMGAKSLCVPFDQPAKILPTDKCINPACTRKPVSYTLFGRSY